MDEGLADWLAGWSIGWRWDGGRARTNCGCEVATEDKREERKEGGCGQGEMFDKLLPLAICLLPRKNLHAGAASHRAANDLNPQDLHFSLNLSPFSTSTLNVPQLQSLSRCAAMVVVNVHFFPPHEISQLGKKRLPPELCSEMARILLQKVLYFPRIVHC